MNAVTSLASAYARAAHWHSGQKRKGQAAEPYVNHLTEVAELVAEATEGGDLALVIAAVLHDAVEDAGVTAREIAAEFGEDVARLVLEVTDDKSLPKEERKRLQVETTPHKSSRAKIIKLADKTSNLTAIRTSPPPWPLERQQAYLDWARAVIAGARGVNRMLEDRFDAAARELEAALRTRG